MGAIIPSAQQHQDLLYKTINKESWLKNTLPMKSLAQRVAPRINRFFANTTKTSERRTVLNDQLKRSIAIAKTATPAVATSVLRTWCNAWITSRRAQAQIGKCKLGCPPPGGERARTLHQMPGPVRTDQLHDSPKNWHRPRFNPRRVSYLLPTTHQTR